MFVKGQSGNPGGIPKVRDYSAALSSLICVSHRATATGYEDVYLTFSLELEESSQNVTNGVENSPEVTKGYIDPAEVTQNGSDGQEMSPKET